MTELTAEQKKEIARKVAGQIVGTCKSLHEFEEFDQDDAVMCAVLDSEIFLCSQCDWWCWNEEMSDFVDDEPRCEDCQ